jgi:probable rRNA maturation factor
MLLVENLQKRVYVNVPLIRYNTLRLLSLVDCANYDMSVTFTGTKKLRRLNRDYREVDKVTDVLSFPRVAIEHDDMVGVPPPPIGGQLYELGSLFISPLYVQDQLDSEEHDGDPLLLRARGRPPTPSESAVELELCNADALHRRFMRLIVHGTCHLLGYTHTLDEQYDRMHRREQELFKRLEDHKRE